MDTLEKVKELKQKMQAIITDIKNNRTEYVSNPDSDFTRKRKQPMDTLINTILNLGSSCLNVELYDAVNFRCLCSPSAFVQQRSKLKYTAFEKLFHEFNKCAEDIRLFRNFRLLAIDGSEIVYPGGSEPEVLLTHSGSSKIAGQHLNATYDIINGFYCDAVIDDNEKAAAVEMVKNVDGCYSNLFVADRGYENFNLMATIEEDLFDYVIRIKDINSNGIAAPFKFPDEEFDLTKEIVLTRKFTGGYMVDPVKYRYLNKGMRFDYIKSSKDDDYSITVRFVRFMITDNTYELIATSVDESLLSIEEIKEIYSMRWGIETGFRKLKNDICLKAVHSSKVNSVRQEIFARLVMYNFTAFVIRFVNSKIKLKKYKYKMKIQFKNASRLCRLYYKSSCNDPPGDFEEQLLLCLSPIRPERKFNRKVRPQGATAFNYRNI